MKLANDGPSHAGNARPPIATWLSSHAEKTLTVDRLCIARDICRRDRAGAAHARDASTTNRSTSTAIPRELRADGFRRRKGAA
jgi:hypothetical protein